MPAYRFIGPEPRYFPDLALSVEPDEVVTLPENPHAHYFEPASADHKPAARKPRKSRRQAPPAPAVIAASPTSTEPVTGTAPASDSQES